jgi:hypothetical protein
MTADGVGDHDGEDVDPSGEVPDGANDVSPEGEDDTWAESEVIDNDWPRSDPIDYDWPRDRE